MKRLAIALVISGAFCSSAALALTPTEREMNNFDLVSKPKSEMAPRPAVAEPAEGGERNIAVEKHKKHMHHHGKHEGKHEEKHEGKPHHKHGHGHKHAHKDEAAKSDAPKADAPK